MIGTVSDYARKFRKLIELKTRPYQFGFIQGHSHLTDRQVSDMRRVLDADAGDNEDIVRDYEERFAALVGQGYAISFAAGRMAFYALLEALGVGAGDEVILPGFTCSVMPNAVLRAGASPVFTNVNVDTFGSDVESVKKMITPRTRVIVAQHSFGIPCNIRNIVEHGKVRGIFVVEDCAITLDSTIEGLNVGNWADAAIFSTDHTKPLNTIIGGILYTKEKSLHTKIRGRCRNLPYLDRLHQKRLFDRFLFERRLCTPERYPDFVILNYLKTKAAQVNAFSHSSTFLESDLGKPTGAHGDYPYPARMPPFLARLGLFELERWNEERRRRKKLLEEYLRLADEINLTGFLPPAYFDETLDIVPLRFVFQHPDRDGIMERMRFVDTGCTWFLDPVIGCPDGLEALGYHRGSCPVSEEAGGKMINWPCVIGPEWEPQLLESFRSALDRPGRARGRRRVGIKALKALFSAVGPRRSNGHRDYWNDIETEKTKTYWIEDPSDMKLVRFLREETNLEKCFMDSIAFAGTLGTIKGTVLDVGAGVGWTSAILSEKQSVSSVVAVDISDHRLNKIAPIVFQQLGGNLSKLEPRVGDFFTMRMEPASFDVIVFCQSLSMFSDLRLILNKVHRLLADGGLMIVACERIFREHPTASYEFLKRKLKHVLKGRADVSGNYGYVDSEYRSAIEETGFKYHFQLLDYPVHANGTGLNAGNHFGVKKAASR